MYQPLLYVWKNRRQPKTVCIFGRFACHNFTCTHLRGPDLNWVSKMSHWLHENGVYIIVRCAIHPHSVFCDLQRLVFFFFLLFFHFRFVRHFIPLSSLKTLCVSREIKSFCYVQDLRLNYFEKVGLIDNFDQTSAQTIITCLFYRFHASKWRFTTFLNSSLMITVLASLIDLIIYTLSTQFKTGSRAGPNKAGLEHRARALKNRPIRKGVS